jgi:hypothetical protein
MSIDRRLLAIIGRRFPAICDVLASEFIRLAWLSESIDRALECSVSSIEMAIG